MEVVSCFSRKGGPIEDVKIKVGEGLRLFVAMKMMFILRSGSLDMKEELHKRMVKPTVTYAAETWGLTMKETCELNFMEMTCLRSVCAVAKMNR